jgi:hypothetical protein
MIPLLPKEQDIIDSAIRGMRGAWPLLPKSLIPGADAVAGLRFYLTASPGSLAPSPESNRMPSYGYVLCRVRELFPDAHRAYYVGRKFPMFMFTHPIIGDLMTNYARIAVNTGIGSWANRTHESVLATLVQQNERRLSSGYPLVVSADALHSLLSAYKKQKQDAATAKSTEKPEDTPRQSVRAALVDEGFAESASDRKRLARESQGTCYLCNAPKPRKVVCAVCGYKPRST